MFMENVCIVEAEPFVDVSCSREGQAYRTHLAILGTIAISYVEHVLPDQIGGIPSFPFAGDFMHED
jgi:hypothetical protein